ncbi:MAG: hypothetical protein KJN84_13405 [Bacteroidia bacterium]|nr:hypothetical protein [Bacteroidia bacterium]
MYRTISITFLLFLSVFCYSQDEVRDLNAVITGGGVIKFYDRSFNEVHKQTGEELVYANSKAAQFYKKGKRQNITSNILGGTAVALTVVIAVGMGGAEDKSIYYYLLAPYAGTIAVALIKLKKAKKNIQRSMDIYNDALLGAIPRHNWQKESSEISFAATQNGLGLVFNF